MRSERDQGACLFQRDFDGAICLNVRDILSFQEKILIDRLSASEVDKITLPVRSTEFHNVPVSVVDACAQDAILQYVVFNGHRL